MVTGIRMGRVSIVAFALSLLLLALLSACYPNPQPVGLTPIPTLAPAEGVTLVPALLRPVQPTAAAPPGGPEQDDVALGAGLYPLHCSTCHGVQGEGIDAPPLRDNQFVQTSSEQEVYAVIADGRVDTEMPGWLQTRGGPLTDIEIARIIAFLHTWQGVPSLPTATPEPAEPTATPTPPNAPTPEPARPSQPGGPGPAASLTGNVAQGRSAFGSLCAICHSAEGLGEVPNPGSDDGTVPELNPIDPTIANPDPKVFAVNVDLFVEHGSLPEGPAPMIMMPSFGDSKMLTDQQIADVIAYVMYLNGVEQAP